MGCDVLNHRQFSNAIFELVDEWCGAISIQMFVSFLETLYVNVRSVWKTTKDGKKLYIIAPLEQIGSKYKTLEKLRQEGARVQAKEFREMAKDFAAGENKDGQTNQKRTKFQAISKQKSEDFENQEAAAETHSLIKAQLEQLKLQHGAQFATPEEEAYFLELLAMREMGPPRWSEDLQRQFREQLKVNVDSLENAPVAQTLKLLDDLEMVYLVRAGQESELDEGFNASILETAQREADITLDRITAERRLAWKSEALRLRIRDSIVRKHESHEQRHWLSPADDETLEILIAESSERTVGSVLGRGGIGGNPSSSPEKLAADARAWFSGANKIEKDGSLCLAKAAPLPPLVGNTGAGIRTAADASHRSASAQSCGRLGPQTVRFRPTHRPTCGCPPCALDHRLWTTAQKKESATQADRATTRSRGPRGVSRQDQEAEATAKTGGNGRKRR